MWSDRKSWWSKKAEDNQGSKLHYKNWCVIKVAVSYKRDINSWNPVSYVYEYKAVARENAPHRYGHNGHLSEVEVENLTKHDAHCVAKGLNFLDGETK
jgi:hypothetical protein